MGLTLRELAEKMTVREMILHAAADNLDAKDREKAYREAERKRNAARGRL